MKNSPNILVEIGPKINLKNYWLDIWLHRELFIFLAWRDIIVRYKQMIIGLMWVLLRPILMMLIFTLVFSKMANLGSDGIPYPLLVLSGILPWQFISNAVSDSSNSVVSNSNLITKIYFPRLIIPTSVIFVNLVDLIISFLLLIAGMFWYEQIPTWRFIFLPGIIIFSALFAAGVGVLAAALTVRFRDIKILIPFVMQLMVYVSPVAYSASLVPSAWKLIYYLNPVAGILDLYRWAIFGIPLYVNGLIICFLLTGLICIFSVFVFQRNENNFADYV